jgi:hypothetical protein
MFNALKALVLIYALSTSEAYAASACAAMMSEASQFTPKAHFLLPEEIIFSGPVTNKVAAGKVIDNDIYIEVAIPEHGNTTKVVVFRDGKIDQLSELSLQNSTAITENTVTRKFALSYTTNLTVTEHLQSGLKEYSLEYLYPEHRETYKFSSKENIAPVYNVELPAYKGIAKPIKIISPREQKPDLSVEITPYKNDEIFLLLRIPTHNKALELKLTHMHTKNGSLIQRYASYPNETAVLTVTTTVVKGVKQHTYQLVLKDENNPSTATDTHYTLRDNQLGKDN